MSVFPWGSRQAAVLMLADGSVFPGWSVGCPGTTVGEVVFNTGMTGYQEVLTDPSYCGQIVTFTCPELGNTGVNDLDAESPRPQAQGVVVKNCSGYTSSWRAQASLQAYLQAHGIVGIAGVDTRALTRCLRTHGAMNGIISTQTEDLEALRQQLLAAPSMEGQRLSGQVTTAVPYTWREATPPEWDYGDPWVRPDPPVRVVAIDFGIKRNILRRLVRYGCEVVVLPASATPQEVLAHDPEGIFLSNGPGDPAAEVQGIATAKALLQVGKPIFGICLGHQILNLALGGSTYKLKFGHHGLNHPCGLTQTVEITSQNHGFAVDLDSVRDPQVQVTHFNLNDHTVAGIRHQQLPLLSVQYHPEASPGPHDADYLFREFVQMILKARSQAL
ncbi:MAG: glutamine-hydrolyzing carbamoyl-phosphate synthase small subunit [Thermostichales cyanobacterium SZTDM-1c_bins_54]